MRASQTVLPFKLAASGESLTAHAGLVLFGEYLRAMGIAGLINHELPGAGSAAVYDPSAYVSPLVLMLAGGGLAEFERHLIRDRASDGRERARRAGVKFGPKHKLTAHQRQEVLAWKAAGESVRAIARSCNVSPNTIGRVW
jgi:hypothetical protein